MEKHKKCPGSKCKHYKPNSQWMSFCRKNCIRQFYFDPNGGGMTIPNNYFDYFNTKY